MTGLLYSDENPTYKCPINRRVSQPSKVILSHVFKSEEKSQAGSMLVNIESNENEVI